MRNLTLFALSLLVANSAWAGNVVKTLSGACGEDPAFRGSGYAFQIDGNAYVVSSEHVFLHAAGSDGEICHAVQWEDGRKDTAVLQAVDWASGLALLQVNSQGSNLPDLASINSANLNNVTDGSEVVTAGYPYRSSGLIRHPVGAVLRRQSERHLLPKLNTVIEIVRGHGEFGMSGGPVYDRQSGQLIGILSHQILKVVEGGDSQIEIPGEGSYNHLLAIPVDYVATWLKSALAPNFAASFVRQTDDQFNRELVVSTAGLTFRSSPTEVSAKPLMAMLMARAGGEDGAGIGGQPNPEGSVVVQVEGEARTNFPVRWYLPERGALYENLLSLTLKRAKIRIPYLLKRTGPDQEIKKVYFRNLEAFFQLLRDPEMSVPLLVDGGTSGDLGERVRRLKHASGLLGLGLTKLEKLPKWSVKARSLFGRLRLVEELSAGENWTFLTSEDLKRLSDTNGAHKDAWRELFSVAFDESVETLRSINSIGCLIDYRCSAEGK